MAIEIRLLQSTERELANNFFNEIYNTNRTFENFLWEFVNGPAGKAIYVIAVDTSKPALKIVGIQCAIPLELKGTDGRLILTAKSEDTLVHPDYRGQKLFEKMYELLFKECTTAGIKYIWGFTPALKAFERIGFSAPFSTSQALMVINPIKAFKHLVNLNPKNTVGDKVKILAFCLMSWVRGWKRLLINTSKLVIEEVKVSDKTSVLNTFYPVAPRYFFIHQSDAYLHWRLTLNPFKNNYRNFKVVYNNIPQADVLINQRQEVSYVEQMLFSSQIASNIRLQTVKKTVSMLLESGTPLIRVLCFNNNEEAIRQIDILKKAGFTYLERGNYFVWKSLDPNNTISVGELFLTRLYTQGNI
jgi:hypothetical protein